MREEHQGRSKKGGDRKMVPRTLHSSEELYRALFDATPEHRTLEELTEGMRQLIKSRKSRH